MVRVKPFALVIVLSLLTASCAVEELNVASDPDNSVTRIVRTKSAPVVMSRKDSLRLLYEYQTRGDVFVISHLAGNRGNYTLELSRSGAISLGVAPETYDFYSSFVEELNVHQ